MEDPAVLIDTAAHAAYLTEAMKVMRDKAKRKSNSATEACRSCIFWELLQWSPQVSFALRSGIKYSTGQSFQREENRESTLGEGKAQTGEQMADLGQPRR